MPTYIKEMNGMKKIYEAPKLDKTTFETEVIMTGSSGIVLPEDEWD